MKGITKDIVKHYDYGSKADDLKKEYNDIFLKYRKEKRKYYLEFDKLKKKKISTNIKLYEKQLNNIKNKINVKIKE